MRSIPLCKQDECRFPKAVLPIQSWISVCRHGPFAWKHRTWMILVQRLIGRPTAVYLTSTGALALAPGGAYHPRNEWGPGAAWTGAPHNVCCVRGDAWKPRRGGRLGLRRPPAPGSAVALGLPRRPPTRSAGPPFAPLTFPHHLVVSLKANSLADRTPKAPF